MTVVTSRFSSRDVARARDIIRLIQREQRDQGVIWEADFERDYPLSSASNAKTLRGLNAERGLTHTRASAATAQVSDSEVVTSIGVDDPRMGLHGYLAEEARTNLLLRCRDVTDASSYAGAGSGHTYTPGVTDGPDSSSLSADRVQVPSGGYPRYFAIAAPGTATNVVTSYWAKAYASSGQLQITTYQVGGATGVYRNDALTGVWGRYSAFLAVAANTNSIVIFPQDGRGSISGTVAGARDSVIDLGQIEYGKWASEVILTSGASATRAADRQVVGADKLVTSGRIGFHTRIKLKGSIGGSNTYTLDPVLWKYDGSNYALVNTTTGTMQVVIAGVSYTTGVGFTAAVGDTLDYWVEGGGGGLQTVVKARKSTDGGVTWGTVTTLGVSTSPQGTIPTASNIDLFGTESLTRTLSGWVKKVRAYAYGRRPLWAM